MVSRSALDAVPLTTRGQICSRRQLRPPCYITWRTWEAFAWTLSESPQPTRELAWEHRLQPRYLPWTSSPPWEPQLWIKRSRASEQLRLLRAFRGGSHRGVHVRTLRLEACDNGIYIRAILLPWEWFGNRTLADLYFFISSFIRFLISISSLFIYSNSFLHFRFFMLISSCSFIHIQCVRFHFFILFSSFVFLHFHFLHLYFSIFISWFSFIHFMGPC